MKKLLIVVSMLFSLNAIANTSSVPGYEQLSDKAKAEVQLQIQKTLEEQQKTESLATQAVANMPDPDTVQKYVDLGQGIGKAFSGAAKEVGITVNEFVQTPVGFMAMVLIVWNYMGSMIVHLFAGILLLITGISLVRWWFFNTIDDKIEYDPEKTDVFGRSRILTVHRTVTESMTGWTMTMFVVVIVGSTIVMFTGW